VETKQSLILSDHIPKATDKTVIIIDGSYHEFFEEEGAEEYFEAMSTWILERVK